MPAALPAEDFIWDAVVIGGGPAGSTAATTLARAGRRVLVLEKAKFPRFHIGESLLPYNRPLFDELGVWEKVEAAGFMKKRGAQFLMGDGSRGNRLDFSHGAFTEFPEAMHVNRATFDQILLDHARQSGAAVLEECTVTGHRLEPGNVVIDYQSAGQTSSVRGRHLIDASGLGNLTANLAAHRRYYEKHRKIAVFGHFDGVEMPGGNEAGDIVIVRRENSWLWLIPLSNHRTSVGLVLDAAEFRAENSPPEKIFAAAVKSTPAVCSRFEHAEAAGKLRVMTDFSYQNEQLVSPRVVRVGDASGFIDPMFSSGVLLAMTSGRDGALAVHEALDSGKSLTPGMRRYEKENRRRVAIYWEFIENFYRLHFTQLFFQPDPRWGLACAVNAVLAGRTELPTGVRLRLRVFFFLAWLNRFLPVAPRIKVR